MQSQDEAESRAASTDDAPEAMESGADQSEVTVRDSVTLGVAGEDVSVKDSVVGAMVAGNVEASDTFVVLGTVGSLEGDSRVLIDTRSAILMGIAGGLVLAVAKWLFGGRGEDSGAAAASGEVEALQGVVPEVSNADEPRQVESDDVG